MARFKTFTNGGSLLPGDLNSIEDDYEFAFSIYKSIIGREASSATSSPTAGTYLLYNIGGSGTMGVVPSSLGGAIFYFDPADWTGNTRVTKLRVRAQCFVNAVAPTTTWTVGLYPVATYGGGSGSSPTVATVGTVVTGSTVVFTTPGVTSQAQSNSGDFTSPVAGYYVLAVANSGTAAINSVVSIRAELQMRQV